MPRVGGLEALKRIHTFDPKIRVIVLTASVDQALGVEGPMDTVVNQIKIEEARKKVLADELAGLRTPEDVPPIDSTVIARELTNAAVDVKALLAGTTAQARQMLRHILDGKKLNAEPLERDGGPNGIRTRVRVRVRLR